MMALEGGSFGLQLGGQATDFVLLLMSPRSADNILTSQVKLGGAASAAAGDRAAFDAFRTESTRRAAWRKKSLILVVLTAPALHIDFECVRVAGCMTHEAVSTDSICDLSAALAFHQG